MYVCERVYTYERGWVGGWVVHYSVVTVNGRYTYERGWVGGWVVHYNVVTVDVRSVHVDVHEDQNT